MATQPPTGISVVVPVRNASDHIARQLEAIDQQDIDRSLEIVLVDDASTDDTCEIFEAWLRASSRRHDYRLTRRMKRGGPNAARNTGVGETTGDVILFCDGDDIVDKGWARSLVDPAHEEDIVGGALLRLGGNTSEPTDWLLFDPVGLGWRYAPGGNMRVRRSVVEMLGGFDENILEGGTEIEFAIRAHKAGLTIGATPDAIVWYRLPVGRSKEFRREFRKERGRAYIARLHPNDVRGRSIGSYIALWRRLGQRISRSPHADEKPITSAALAGRVVGWAVWWLRFRSLPDDPRHCGASS